MIELRSLRYFLAVAEAGHITRAAERLGIAQPPLTRQIQGLERDLGVPLFVRHPRGVTLTEVGEAVAAEVGAILDGAERLKETAQRAARGEAGRIAVGYTSSAAFNPFVPRLIRAFRRAWPGVRIGLEEDSTLQMVQALREARLDAAFIRSSTADLTGLLIEPVLEEPMVAAAPADHPLAARKRIALADLAGETFILYRRPAGQGLYDAIIAACHAAGFSPQVGQEAPRLPSTLSLVGAGLGVSIVPASMRSMNVEGVAYLDITGAHGLSAPLLMATRRGERSLIVRRLREAAKAEAS
jgi:DNA-binding transcriptional LysR family regulator